MKVKTHLRVAKGPKGPRLEASTKPNYKPLTRGVGGWDKEPLPTAMFAVVFDIPDELFNRASIVLAEIAVDSDTGSIAAEVVHVD